MATGTISQDLTLESNHHLSLSHKILDTYVTGNSTWFELISGFIFL